MYISIVKKIALASPPFPGSINDGLYWVEKLVKAAAKEQAEIICFPESYIPGYPAEEFEVEERSPEKLQAALDKTCQIAAENAIAIILPMDWYQADDLLNVAHVISNTGIVGLPGKKSTGPF